jgi:hypothetical protein
MIRKYVDNSLTISIWFVEVSKLEKSRELIGRKTLKNK